MTRTRRLPRLLLAAALLAVPAAPSAPLLAASPQPGCAAAPQGTLRRFFCEQQAAGRKVMLDGYLYDVVAAEAEYLVLGPPTAPRLLVPYASIRRVELPREAGQPVTVTLRA